MKYQFARYFTWHNNDQITVEADSLDDADRLADDLEQFPSPGTDNAELYHVETELLNVAEAAAHAQVRTEERKQQDTIPATVRSDDGNLSVAFNAAPYFEQASDAELRALDSESYCSSYEADAVARHVEDLDPQVERFFWYLETAYPEGGDHAGFEVDVNQLAAERWIQRHRPELWAQLSAK